MDPESREELKKLIGRTVRDVRVSDDADDYGFELVFDDGTVLEVYDIRCPLLDECRMEDELKGGGVAWCVSSESDER